VALTLSHDEVYRKLQFEAFFSHILTLNIDGAKKQQAILRDIQRHPFKPRIAHMDFLRIQADREIQIRVPLHFVNEEEAVGVRTQGGEVSHLETEVEVVCLPKHLPEYIEVDIAALDVGDTAALDVGDTLHLSDLGLPAGVQLVDLLHGDDNDRGVVSVHMPRVTAEEDLEVEEEVEAAEGEAEEGEEAGGDEAEGEADSGDDGDDGDDKG